MLSLNVKFYVVFCNTRGNLLPDSITTNPGRRATYNAG
jgi:hypothetical protein